jgi:AAA ATPase domain
MAVPAGSGAHRARWSDGALVGRDELIDELLVAAREAAGGAGSIVLLTGEAGIGKTSLARLLARDVGDRLAVSWGTCVADQSAPPFWPWRTLIPVEPPDDLPPSEHALGARRFERLSTLRDLVRA